MISSISLSLINVSSLYKILKDNIYHKSRKMHAVKKLVHTDKLIEDMKEKLKE